MALSRALKVAVRAALRVGEMLESEVISVCVDSSVETSALRDWALKEDEMALVEAALMRSARKLISLLSRLKRLARMVASMDWLVLYSSVARAIAWGTMTGFALAALTAALAVLLAMMIWLSMVWLGVQLFSSTRLSNGLINAASALKFAAVGTALAVSMANLSVGFCVSISIRKRSNPLSFSDSMKAFRAG